MAVFGMPGGAEWWILLVVCGGLVIPIALVVWLVTLFGRSRQSNAFPATPAAPASWLPDPTGRHELRYWNGVSWTPSVRDGDSESSDPV